MGNSNSTKCRGPEKAREGTKFAAPRRYSKLVAAKRYRIAALMVDLTKRIKLPAQGVQAGKAKRFQWATRDFQAVLRRLPALESSTADCNDLGGSGPLWRRAFPISFVHPRLFRLFGRYVKKFFLVVAPFVNLTLSCFYKIPWQAQIGNQ